MSKTICWVCGGVPIGRETIRAIEYLNVDLYLYGDDGVVLGLGFGERREGLRVEEVFGWR